MPLSKQPVEVLEFCLDHHLVPHDGVVEGLDEKVLGLHRQDVVANVLCRLPALRPTGFILPAL